MSARGGYRADLAHVHDAGYGDFARESAPGLLALLRRGGVRTGLVVDLGCGSGLWARELVAAGYGVLGIDVSRAMIALARRRVPEARFRRGSLLDAALPACDAVTALGECLSYRFDERVGESSLARLFRRVHAALRPAGLFVFDVRVSERGSPSARRIHCAEGDGWAVLMRAEADAGRRELTRRITTFRRVGRLYRRDHEVHRLRLYDPAGVAAALRRAGFRVRVLRGYGRRRFPAGVRAFAARKP